MLIVEDDADLRSELAALLGEEGYQTATAANGLVAMDLLATSSLPDVIVLDLMMPESDGYDFRRRQLAQPDLAGIPVIAMTADGRAQARLDELRVQGFLRKPFDVGDLLAAIASLTSCR